MPLTKNVRGALERAMRDAGWTDAGQGWQGKEFALTLHPDKTRLIGFGRCRPLLLTAVVRRTNQARQLKLTTAARMPVNTWRAELMFRLPASWLN